MKNKKFPVGSNVKILIDNCQKLRHRALFLVKGKNSKEKVMTLHHFLYSLKKEPVSILWCHKKGCDMSRENKKYAKQLEKKIKSGKIDVSKENPFEVFLASASVKYCTFKDTSSVLGNTYGMCVIQDFDALTPNSLCRVIETVEGGGLIVFLLEEINSLRELFSLKMTIHKKLKTYSHASISPLFNERFVLSLGWCKACLILDENMHTDLELCYHSKTLQAYKPKLLEDAEASQTELADLLKSLSDGEKPLPQLTACCRTVDQTRCLLKMIDILTENSNWSTFSVTASRGRGKSAVLGLAVAAAIYYNICNIFITSPSPENLSTFFEFVFKGFDVLEYKEEQDYEIIQSTNPEFHKAVIRVNIFREHRQTIQYIETSDHAKVSHAELIIIDEAAAIPLNQVKAFIGHHNVFMASTINGYEGTGRSLSLKLLSQLRRQSVPVGAVATSSTDGSSTCRPLYELSMSESIRYGNKDPVEKWLYKLLCLEATSFVPIVQYCPPPENCNLYFVNKDVLFSGHKETEQFLNQIMALLVASHYRNSPDDLQVLADAPAHQLFVLLTPVRSTDGSAVPTVLCVLQVCIEGGIPANVSQNVHLKGERPSGDLVSWVLMNSFLDPSLTNYIGVRIVRIATHSDYQSMGYGSRALTLLHEYYQGKIIDLEDLNKEINLCNNTSEEVQDNSVIMPKIISKPLLSKLSSRAPEDVSYLSVSFGITKQLFKFWMKANFIPVYLGQVANKVTGEHSCIMIRTVESSNGESIQAEWLQNISEDFMRRYLALLGGPFQNLQSTLAFSIIKTLLKHIAHNAITWSELQMLVTGHDLVRLEKYSKNMAERHLITDLLPSIANLFFTSRFPDISLSAIQSCLLLGTGLQFKTLEIIAVEIDLPIESALGHFNRAIRRLSKVMQAIQESSIASYINIPKETKEFIPVDITLDEDLNKAAKDFKTVYDKSHPLGNLSHYTIKGDDSLWEETANMKQNIISIKSKRKVLTMTQEQIDQEIQKITKKKKPRLKK